MVRKNVMEWVDNKIMPYYEKTDLGHRKGHIKSVIKNAMLLGLNYGLDLEILYVAAACHDIGLSLGERKNHHLESGRLINTVHYNELSDLGFSGKDIALIELCCVQHRASCGEVVENIYAKVISDADTYADFSIVNSIERAIYARIHGVDNLRDIKRSKEKIKKECHEHLMNKYSRDGYAKFLLPDTEEILDVNIEEFRILLSDSPSWYPESFDVAFEYAWIHALTKKKFFSNEEVGGLYDEN